MWYRLAVILLLALLPGEPVGARVTPDALPEVAVATLPTEAQRTLAFADALGQRS